MCTFTCVTFTLLMPPFTFISVTFSLLRSAFTFTSVTFTLSRWTFSFTCVQVSFYFHHHLFKVSFYLCTFQRMFHFQIQFFQGVFHFHFYSFKVFPIIHYHLPVSNPHSPSNTKFQFLVFINTFDRTSSFEQCYDSSAPPVLKSPL